MFCHPCIENMEIQCKNYPNFTTKPNFIEKMTGTFMETVFRPSNWMPTRVSCSVAEALLCWIISISPGVCEVQFPPLADELDVI